MKTTRRTRRTRLLVIAGLGAQTLLLFPPQSASAAFISNPTTVVKSVTSSSFTIKAHAVHATRYRVFASLTKADVLYTNLTSGHTNALKSPVSSKAVTIRGLAYSAAPYYYRVEAMSGGHFRYSAIGSVGLRPEAPTDVTASGGSGGAARSSLANGSTVAPYLTWTSPAAGFEVEQATNPNFTSGRRVYQMREAGDQFTPYGLQDGQTYYFRVRAVNGGTSSVYSKSVSATQRSHEQGVTVMSYNVLEATGDGQSEGGQHVAPWSKRKIGAAKLIERANPDVIAIQEAASFVGKGQERQIDSLHALLRHTYKLAHTEIAPGHPGWHRTGQYILYRKSEFKAVGAGNDWAIGTQSFQRYAAYQVLENRTSGARFLMVDPHLLHGGSRHDGVLRGQETSDMLQDANAYAQAHNNVPIVYAGDFNSHAKDVPYDGPGIEMRKANVADAFSVAQSLTNQRYDSANGYYRRPPAYRAYIDHVFVPPGVSVKSWKLILRVRHGRFVGVIPSDHNPLVVHLDYPY